MLIMAEESLTNVMRDLFHKLASGSAASASLIVAVDLTSQDSGGALAPAIPGVAKRCSGIQHKLVILNRG
jgi:hypothetical protein